VIIFPAAFSPPSFLCAPDGGVMFWVGGGCWPREYGRRTLVTLGWDKSDLYRYSVRGCDSALFALSADQLSVFRKQNLLSSRSFVMTLESCSKKLDIFSPPSRTEFYYPSSPFSMVGDNPKLK